MCCQFGTFRLSLALCANGCLMIYPFLLSLLAFFSAQPITVVLFCLLIYFLFNDASGHSVFQSL